MELRDQSMSVESTDKDLTLNEEVVITSNGNEETTVIDTNDTDVSDTDETSEPSKHLSKEEIIAELDNISRKEGAEIARDEVTHLKQLFYAIRKVELVEEKKAFIERGNEESAFAPMPDPLEAKLHELLNNIKEKKAQYTALIEAQRRENLEKKQAIIAELEKMAEDTDRKSVV